MTHVTPEDERLAARVARVTGRRCAGWKIASIRESGLITWDRPGKQGKPGRASGSYPAGTEKQAAEALELIRRKVDRDTVAAALFLADRPVTLTALRRFGRRQMEELGQALVAIGAMSDLEREAAFKASRSEVVKMLRALLGNVAGDFFEWAVALMAEDPGLAEVAHPATAKVLAEKPWTPERDYTDPHAVEQGSPPAATVEQATRWAAAGEFLRKRQPEILVRMADSANWDVTRRQVQVLIECERARRTAAIYFPKTAVVHEANPLARSLLAGRRNRRPDEVRAAVLLPFFFLAPEMQGAQAVTSAVTHWQRVRDQLRALTTLGRDCPHRWRGVLDDRFIAAGTVSSPPGLDRWAAKWADRHPELMRLLFVADEEGVST